MWSPRVALIPKIAGLALSAKNLWTAETCVADVSWFARVVESADGQTAIQIRCEPSEGVHPEAVVDWRCVAEMDLDMGHAGEDGAGLVSPLYFKVSHTFSSLDDTAELVVDSYLFQFATEVEIRISPKILNLECTPFWDPTLYSPHDAIVGIQVDPTEPAFFADKSILAAQSPLFFDLFFQREALKFSTGAGVIQLEDFQAMGLEAISMDELWALLECVHFSTPTTMVNLERMLDIAVTLQLRTVVRQLSMEISLHPQLSLARRLMICARNGFEDCMVRALEHADVASILDVEQHAAFSGLLQDIQIAVLRRKFELFAALPSIGTPRGGGGCAPAVKKLLNIMAPFSVSEAG